MSTLVEALSLLTPFDISVRKIRLGPDEDGGYVFADALSTDQPVLSFGISTEYRFDESMAARGHDVHLFDHTIEGIETRSKRLHFHKEGVSGRTEPSADLYTIADHFQRHGISSDRVLMKMDVEGWEFDALTACPEDVLSRVEQLVIEVHSLSHLEDPSYRARFVALFQKLNRIFTLFHVHANNFDGGNKFAFVEGLPVCEHLEVSYIRTDRVERSASRTLYPTMFDFPNVGYTDKRLWFFPFLPSSLDEAAFGASWAATERHRRGRTGPEGSECAALTSSREASLLRRVGGSLQKAFRQH